MSVKDPACSAGLQPGVPGEPAFGLLGWETGVPSDANSLVAQPS